MKFALATLAFGLGASALHIPRTSCSFSLVASGGVNGTVGQLSDGQNRINGSYAEATYSINNGQITDSSNRGCILTPPSTQFQCDVGAAPTGGFSIGCNGEVSVNGSTAFYACPATDTEYNIYTSPVENQPNCKNITLSATGCYNACTTTQTQIQTQTQKETQTQTQTQVQTQTEEETQTQTQTQVQVQTKTQEETQTQVQTQTAAGPTVYETQTVQSTCPSPVTSTVTSTVSSVKTEQVTSTVTQSAQTQTETVTATQSAQTVTVTKPAQTVTETSPAQTVTVTQPAQTVSETSPAQTVSVTQPAQTVSETETETPAASTPVATSSAAPSPSKTSSATPSPTSSSCATTLSGNYQYPHLIVPVSSASPNTAYGTSYNGIVNSTVSSIFNFDIPSSYTGTCSLIFLFPEQSQLETSSYTFSGNGVIDFEQLSTVASQSTTYASQGSVKTNFGDFTVTPGSSTVISTFACPAGEAVSYELSAVSGTALNYFQDYNPSPIGLYITTC